MSKKEKQLPIPPNKPFGRGKKFEGEENGGELTADRMAVAAAEGKLDEFLKKEMPDNEYARNLATMMMGMTGIMPGGATPQPAAAASSEQTEAEGVETTGVTDDVRRAIEGGDVQVLMAILRREHRKRNPGAEMPEAAAEQPKDVQGASQNIPAIDKELIDALVQIAQENSVSLDWIILRAVKVYVQEYRKTGKL